MQRVLPMLPFICMLYYITVGMLNQAYFVRESNLLYQGIHSGFEKILCKSFLPQILSIHMMKDVMHCAYRDP